MVPEVGDGERAELLAVSDDARHHRLQHLGRPPQRLRQEHLRFKHDISFAFRILHESRVARILLGIKR